MERLPTEAMVFFFWIYLTREQIHVQKCDSSTKSMADMEQMELSGNQEKTLWVDVGSMAMRLTLGISSLRLFKSLFSSRKKAPASYMLNSWMIAIWHPFLPEFFSYAILLSVSTSCPDRFLLCLWVWFRANNVYLLSTILLPPPLLRIHDGRLLLGHSSWFGNGVPIVDVGWMLLFWMWSWRCKLSSHSGSSLVDACFLFYQVYETQCLSTKKDGRGGKEKLWIWRCISTAWNLLPMLLLAYF